MIPFDKVFEDKFSKDELTDEVRFTKDDLKYFYEKGLENALKIYPDYKVEYKDRPFQYIDELEKRNFVLEKRSEEKNSIIRFLKRELMHKVSYRKRMKEQYKELKAKYEKEKKVHKDDMDDLLNSPLSPFNMSEII